MIDIWKYYMWQSEWKPAYFALIGISRNIVLKCHLQKPNLTFLLGLFVKQYNTIGFYIAGVGGGKDPS